MKYSLEKIESHGDSQEEILTNWIGDNFTYLIAYFVSRNTNAA